MRQRANAWSPGQKILNDTGARDPSTPFHQPVPSTARIVWADDGEEHIETEALGWSDGDPTCGLLLAWWSLDPQASLPAAGPTQQVTALWLRKRLTARDQRRRCHVGRWLFHLGRHAWERKHSPDVGGPGADYEQCSRCGKERNVYGKPAGAGPTGGMM